MYSSQGDFQSTGGNGFAGQVGQFIVFAQNQVIAIQGHNGAAHTVFACQGINLCFLGQVHGGDIGQRKVATL